MQMVRHHYIGQEVNKQANHVTHVQHGGHPEYLGFNYDT
jgi:hypothetical protein